MPRQQLLLPAAAAFGVALGALAAGAVAPQLVLFVAGTTGLILLVLLFLRTKAPATARVEHAAGQGWEHFRRELKRSRRQEYPLALIRLPVNGESSTGRERVAERERVAAAVAKMLRVTDHVWLDGKDVYALLTDTHREMAVMLMDRLHRAVPDGPTWDSARLAAFPGDGVTAGKLLNTLHAPEPTTAAEGMGALEPRLSRLEPDRNA